LVLFIGERAILGYVTPAQPLPTPSTKLAPSDEELGRGQLPTADYLVLFCEVLADRHGRRLRGRGWWPGFCVEVVDGWCQ